MYILGGEDHGACQSCDQSSEHPSLVVVHVVVAEGPAVDPQELRMFLEDRDQSEHVLEGLVALLGGVLMQVDIHDGAPEGRARSKCRGVVLGSFHCANSHDRSLLAEQDDLTICWSISEARRDSPQHHRRYQTSRPSYRLHRLQTL